MSDSPIDPVSRQLRWARGSRGQARVWQPPHDGDLVWYQSRGSSWSLAA